MIKPEQVPKGLALIARKAWAEGVGPTNDDDWNAAIAAALNAWPEARMRTTFHPNDDGVWIVPQHMWSLPLPAEARDDHRD